MSFTSVFPTTLALRLRSYLSLFKPLAPLKPLRFFTEFSSPYLSSAAKARYNAFPCVVVLVYHHLNKHRTLTALHLRRHVLVSSFPFLCTSASLPLAPEETTNT